MTDEDTGPTSLFTGAMASPIKRRVKTIEILADATFTVLEFMWDGGEALQAAPTAITYPVGAFADLDNVKRFQLLTGTILVTFYAGPDLP